MIMRSRHESMQTPMKARLYKLTVGKPHWPRSQIQKYQLPSPLVLKLANITVSVIESSTGCVCLPFIFGGLWKLCASRYE